MARRLRSAGIIHAMNWAYCAKDVTGFRNTTSPPLHVANASQGLAHHDAAPCAESRPTLQGAMSSTGALATLRAGRIVMPRTGSSRSEFLAAALLFAVGSVVAAFAVAVLITYHNGAAVLRSLGANQLQYDNAWVVLLVGLSLILYALRLRGPGRLCAVAAMLVSGLRIAAYFFPHAIATHPILANPWLTHSAGEYNAMGILTAAVALVLGAALAFLLPASNRAPWRSVALAILAATVVAVSLLIAFGAWSGSAFAAQSLQLGGDERTNSPLLILLGATLLIYPLMGSEHERLALGRFAPVIVGLAVFVCVLVVWHAALTQEARYVRHGTELVAAAARSEIERDLRARVDIIERLADRMSIHDFNADVWQREGASILSDIDEFRSLAWSGPDYVIRWVARPATPSASTYVPIPFGSLPWSLPLRRARPR